MIFKRMREDDEADVAPDGRAGGQARPAKGEEHGGTRREVTVIGAGARLEGNVVSAGSSGSTARSRGRSTPRAT